MTVRFRAPRVNSPEREPRGPRHGRPRTAAALVLLLALAPLPAAGNGWEHGAIPFEALLRALAFEQAETRRRAAESLGHRGQAEAVEPLLRRLAAPEEAPQVRSAIYLALGRLRDARAGSALANCLETESREELRSDCAAALGMLGDPVAVPRLVHALRDEERLLVRMRAAGALGHLPEPAAVAALGALATGDGPGPLRLQAIRALGRTRDPAAAAPLLAALAAARSDRERLAAVDALAEVRPAQARAPLTALLESSADPELRVRIVVALGAIQDGDAAPTLVRLLADPVPAVRYFAVEGLRALGRADAAGPVARLALDIGRRLAARHTHELMADLAAARADLSVQEVALRTLTALDAAQGLEALLQAARPRSVTRDSAEALSLAEGFFEVRRAALVGLGVTRSRRAAAALLGPGGLGDGDFRLRASAVHALGALGFTDTAGRVAAALDDPAAEVRWTAAEVLGRLGQRSASAPLRRRLRDRDPEVRRQAALALGYLGDRPSLPSLRALARTDDDGRVREAAA